MFRKDLRLFFAPDSSSAGSGQSDADSDSGTAAPEETGAKNKKSSKQIASKKADPVPEHDSSENDSADAAPEETGAKNKKSASQIATPKPDENTDLRELIAAHAKAEQLTADLDTAKRAHAEISGQLTAYKTYALKAAKSALDVAPKFVQERVKLDENDPIRTILEVENLVQIYQEAVRAANASNGSAPPPAAGADSPPQRPPSLWSPVGPTPRKR